MVQHHDPHVSASFAVPPEGRARPASSAQESMSVLCTGCAWSSAVCAAACNTCAPRKRRWAVVSRHSSIPWCMGCRAVSTHKGFALVCQQDPDDQECVQVPRAPPLAIRSLLFSVMARLRCCCSACAFNVSAAAARGSIAFTPTRWCCQGSVLGARDPSEPRCCPVIGLYRFLS